MSGTPPPFAERPFPGDALAHRVAGRPDRIWFFESGQRSVADLQSALAVVGRRLEDHARILDFGCGCGRILAWLSPLAQKSELHGVDIDREAIEWTAAHLPWAKLYVNQPLPPLDFPDDFFDLVYCHSVFSHIDEDYQDRWLRELRRITRMGGFLLLSVHGEHAFCRLEDDWRKQKVDPWPFRQARDRQGLLHIADDQWTGGPFPDFYHTTFHTPGYVFAHWGEFFKVRAYVPRGALDYQDLVLLERSPEVSSPVPAPRAVPSGAIDRAAAVVAAGPRMDYPTRFGPVSRLARRLVLRVLRHYAGHQREVQETTIAALRDLTAHQRLLDQKTRAHEARLDEFDSR